MRSRWRTTLLVLSLAFVGLSAAGCGDGAVKEQPAASSPAPAAAVKVFIDNFTFDPPELTVAPGTKVTWYNRDDVPHTATSTARPKLFDSSTLDTDQAFTHAFTVPGTYEYYCAVHPKMTGRVIVK